MKQRNERLRTLVLCSLFAAITAILAQVNIPIQPVPFSGQTLAVGLTATILGSKRGVIAMIAYISLGAIGVPVFAEMKAGVHVLVGPTGGYIYSFIVAAFVTGLILEKTTFSIKMAMIANTVGMIITLAIGTVHLKLLGEMTWSAALAIGVYPFIIVGLVKAFLASWIGIQVRNRLVQAKLIRFEKQVVA